MDTRAAGLTIGRVARSAGLAIDTVRYYEREGLLEKPARTASGYRHYTTDAVARLSFIRQAKELGFSLSEIKELLALRVTPGKSCVDVRARAEAKIADVDQRISQLNRMKRALVELAAACSGRGPTSECPILDALENRDIRR
ncbi:MAG TPA: heavy metal-responsive transcriptional regulator [Burkholderiales bacterium]|nr:heavy metal-responsive transcriptional regulator [Burkholderiales bacterium]